MPTVLITGASRGLGWDFARRYAELGWKVHACARHEGPLRELKGDLHFHPLDVTNYGTVKKLAAALSDETIDVLICNAGIGGSADYGGQMLGFLNPGVFSEIFEVNTLAPLMMAEAFADHVTRSQQKKVIAITSILGSIANNNGGRYFYRASKAALNMAWNCLAKDLASEKAICVALHPGWVQTDMGGRSAPLTIEQSVPAMMKVIDGLKPSDNGRYLQYDGQELAW